MCSLGFTYFLFFLSSWSLFKMIILKFLRWDPYLGFVAELSFANWAIFPHIILASAFSWDLRTVAFPSLNRLDYSGGESHPSTLLANLAPCRHFLEMLMLVITHVTSISLKVHTPCICWTAATLYCFASLSLTFISASNLASDFAASLMALWVRQG